MYLARLIYTSHATQKMHPTDIETILSASRKNNEALAVSGLLYFNHQYFIQCLEGSRSNINKIYHRILNDQRHDEPLILDYREIVTRDFSQWTMGYLPETDRTRNIYKRFSATGEFTPYHMSGESCHQLMLDLSHQVKSV